MYFADLSKYSHQWIDSNHKSPTALSIGWIDRDHPYKLGDVPSNFLDSLWNFCFYPTLLKLGYYECSFCNTPVSGLLANRNGQETVLGAGEIWIFGKNDLFYVAPDLIYHYITCHNYCPPEEFIQAVLFSPQPGSEEYRRFVKNMGWY
jgi:hypothetical protein